MSPQKDDHNARVAALEAAINCYGGSIYRYYLRLTRDPHFTADVMQDLWLYVFVNFPIDKFNNFGYLFTKARHLMVDRLRQQSNRRRKVDADAEQLDKVISPPVFAEPGNEEEEAMLKEKFWENFPRIDATEQQKDCYWLSERYGYTIEAISKRIGVPMSTVGRWLKSIAAKMEEIWIKENE